MTDLLTPGQVVSWGYNRPAPPHERTPEERLLHRLSRDYLTLWEKHEKKKAALKDRGVIETVLEICEEERDALKVRVKELETTIGWYEEKHPND